MDGTYDIYRDITDNIAVLRHAGDVTGQASGNLHNASSALAVQIAHLRAATQEFLIAVRATA